MKRIGKYINETILIKSLNYGKVNKTNDVIDCRVKNKIKNRKSKRIHNTNDVIDHRDTKHYLLNRFKYVR